jgi:hypothetical protein
MNERWNPVVELFDVAMQRAPDERSSFVQQACAGDQRFVNNNSERCSPRRVTLHNL